MTCNKCRHWGGRDDEPEKDGVCRGVPPVPIVMPVTQKVIAGGTATEYRVNSYFPVVRGTTPKCGIFKSKEAEA